MFKKMLTIVIIILVAITLIVFVAFMLWNNFGKSENADPNVEAQNSVGHVEAKKLSAKVKNELTVVVDEVLTNLANKDFIKFKLAFELSNEDAKEEFEMLMPEVTNAIIQTVSDMSPEDVQGSKGQDAYISLLMNTLNTTILTKGKVTRVSFMTFILP